MHLNWIIIWGQREATSQNKRIVPKIVSSDHIYCQYFNIHLALKNMNFKYVSYFFFFCTQSIPEIELKLRFRISENVDIFIKRNVIAGVFFFFFFFFFRSSKHHLWTLKTDFALLFFLRISADTTENRKWKKKRKNSL